MVLVFDEKAENGRGGSVLEDLANKLNALSKDKARWKALDKSKHSEEDVHLLYLKWKIAQIDEVEKGVQAYSHPGQHFSREYRTLEGDCGSLLTDLDRINHSGREDLKNLRKNAFAKVNRLIETLKSKVHPDGRVCSRCEVQK